MREPIKLGALVLLHLFDLVSSIPVDMQSSTRKIDIWVTNSNTLNSTTGNRLLHRPSHILSAISQQDTHGSTSENTDDGMHLSERKLPRARENTNFNSTHRSVPYTDGTHVATSTNGSSNHTLGAGTRKLNSTQMSWNNTGSRLTTYGPATAEAVAGALSIALVNNLPSNDVKVYISGLDPTGSLIMLGQSGAWEYPTGTSEAPEPVTANVALSLGAPSTTTTFTLPGYIESARVWVAVGGLQFYSVATAQGPGLVEPAVANPNDANAEVNYAFAEMSWSAQYGLYADITNVDFVGLPLGLKLVQSDNSVVSVLGTPSNAPQDLCDKLNAQSQVDKKPWKSLCAYDASGKLVRVLAPATLTATQPNIFGRYFSRYVDDVWKHYRQNDLTINTQSTPGNVTCRVNGDQLQCAGDNRGYAKPNSLDIFGCNTGPFAIQKGDNAVHYAVVPRLCAAFNRATLLLAGGNVQPSLPPSSYYRNENRPRKSRPKNWYSELVHEMEVGGKGYAFSYDDVTPSSGQDQSGLVNSRSPKTLNIIVGGT